MAYDAPLPPPLRPESLTEHAEAELESFLAERRPHGVEVQGKVRFGDAAAEVLAEAREWQADLLVVGTQGRSGLARLMLGSVAGPVLRGAACNVLVIPATMLLATEPPPAHQGEPIAARTASEVRPPAFAR